jgi:hypothetical protein
MLIRTPALISAVSRLLQRLAMICLQALRGVIVDHHLGRTEAADRVVQGHDAESRVHWV